MVRSRRLVERLNATSGCDPPCEGKPRQNTISSDKALILLDYLFDPVVDRRLSRSEAPFTSLKGGVVER